MSLSRLTASRAADLSATFTRGGVSWRRDRRALHVQVQRPAQLNALDHDVVTLLRATLEDAADDHEVATVVLSGAGDRGWSAGGDLMFLHRDGRGEGTAALPFWRDLYDLVLVVAEHPKPVVSLMDGLALGGGLGVAARASHRVVTERSVVGMPETRIGFFPDTGGLHLLSHLDGEVGTYLALCAETVGGADAIDVGLADRFVWSDDLPRLVDRLAVDPVDVALETVAVPAADVPQGRDLPAQAWIDACFGAEDPVEVLHRLQDHPDERAVLAGAVLASRSPTAVTATLLGLRAAADLDLPADLALELRLAALLRRSHDFLEGIRARLVDKDRDPAWAPASWAEVDVVALREVLAGAPRR